MAFMLVLLAVAHSQVSASAATDTEAAEIVVTAQKRSETAQCLPAAITVVSSETLENRDVVDPGGVENLLPSAKMHVEGSVVQLFIKGVGSQLDYPWLPTSVGLNLDGGSICRYCAGCAFYDIQRVEVRQGPQGTLYGSWAVGRVVNILSNRPTSEWLTDAKVEYGNYNIRHETMIENVPVTSN